MGGKNCWPDKKEKEADSAPSPPPKSDNSDSTNNVQNSGNKSVSDNKIEIKIRCCDYTNKKD